MVKWNKNSNLKCVVLCAGRGTRTRFRFTLKMIKNERPKFFSNLKKAPKPLFKVFDKPVLGWVVDHWKKYTDDFIFVVGYKKDKVIDYIKTLPINYTIVEQKEPKGIAHALFLAKDHLSDNFILVLGDCICNGEFKIPENMNQGVAAWQTNNIDDIKRSFSIEHEDGKIHRVVEKPQNPPNKLCGLGFYFLNKKVLDYIDKTPPSSLRNEVEITDVLQNMIDSGEHLHMVEFGGQYLNITYPEDIEIAEKILKDLS